MQIKSLYKPFVSRETGAAEIVTKTSPIGLRGILLVMKLTIVLLFAAMLQATASSNAQTVNYAAESVSLEQVFVVIKQQTGYVFFYREEDIRGLPAISVSFRNTPLGAALQETLKGQPLQYNIQGKTIFITTSSTLRREGSGRVETISADLAIEISGVVTDEKGEPLAGVSVMVKGTQMGTTTNADGRFQLSVSSVNNLELIFSFVGYATQTVKAGSRTVFDIVLKEAVSDLSDIVVVGYGTQKKADLTGAISTVSTSQYANQPVNRLDQVLQGRTAGVEVTNVSGAPGADVRIRVRGSNSLLGDNNPLYVVDGFVGADFSTINPDNIESIQVLKDASSTAIYGSRGANGVVIITTKKGKRGTNSITYSGNVSTSKVLRTYEVMSAAEYAETINQRNIASGINPPFTDTEINNFKIKGGTDWQKEIYRNAIGQEHELDLSGGGEKTTYFVSGNYLNQQGIVKNTDYNRLNLRSNISTKITDKLMVDVNIALNTNKNNNIGLITGLANPVVQAVGWSPTMPAYDASGNLTVRDPLSSILPSPLIYLEQRKNIVQNNFQNLTSHARYEILDDLAFDATFVMNHLTSNGNYFASQNANNGGPSSASKSNYESLTIQETNTLNYKHTFNDVHSLDVTGVLEMQKFKDNSLNGSASNLLIPDLMYNNLGLSGAKQTGSDLSSWTLLSLLGRVNYAYNNKYLVTASIRRDGSSRFQKANRNSVFSAFALGWNLGEEEFVKAWDVFSHLKIRGSWGQTGSQAIQPFATQSTYGTVTTNFSNNDITSGLVLGNPGNPNLRWETTTQTDVGLEFGILNNKLNFEFDLFSKETKDLLINRPLPGYVGGGSIASNVGTVTNKGWEFSVGTDLLNGTEIGWNSNLNFSFVKNRVKSLGGISDKIFTNANVGAGTSTQSEFVIVPGYSMGSYWGLKYLGTWKPGHESDASQYGAIPGDSRYEDLDGDHIYSANDYQIIGTGMPTSTLGWNNTLTYKRFTFNLFVLGVFGVDKLNLTEAAMMTGTGDIRQFTSRKILDRYIPGINETSNIQGFSSSTQNFTQSTQFLEDGSFVRLKNISLTYDLPLTLAHKKTNLKLFISGLNLLTITSYNGQDPESSNKGSDIDVVQGIDYGSYPNSKIYTFGVKLNLQ